MFDANDVLDENARSQVAVAAASSMSLMTILKMVLAWCLLLIAMIGFVYLAFKAREGSYWEALWVEFSSAVAIFMLSPLVLARTEGNLKKTSVALITCSFFLATLAFFLHGALQLLLINLAVGLILLLLLEVFFENILLKGIEERFSEELKDLWFEAGVASVTQPPPNNRAGSGPQPSATDTGSPGYIPGQ
ncbi:hypothetical protein [Paraburkholderia sp. J94]|uniref:hypothetical protein n=1 Tax=Paraburkholderia sp. J94 TaxID=2805441 RepID=UPI002AB05C4E|nr:hypothetical protein [Paraburkholderia sp. J94]